MREYRHLYPTVHVPRDGQELCQPPGSIALTASLAQLADMRGSTLLRVAVAVSCVSVALARNILLTNDDGWAVAQIRAQYKELTDAGYDVRHICLSTVCVVDF